MGLFRNACRKSAKQNNLDPKVWTESNIKTMKDQLKQMGISIDWDREISTCSQIITNTNKNYFRIF